MSYDLLVFDPGSAPKDRASFLGWYEQQIRWTEPHNYADVAVTTASLRVWFREIISDFPVLNGPVAASDIDNDRVTDYSIGHHVIYAAFRWSEAGPARHAVMRLAEKHGVGFFDASAQDGDAWAPSPEGVLERLPRLATLDDARRRRPLSVQVDADGWTTCANCGRRFKVSDARVFADQTHLKCSQRLTLVWS